ncbi:Methionine aminopeptidase [Candidatus Gugararchaeum adminiculabundum]|nr:Methionine aminopeptidase [Candidatus Gugararchaeum adminiculabundum]
MAKHEHEHGEDDEHGHSGHEHEEDEEEFNLEKYRKAGKVAAEVLDDARKLMMVGESVLEIAETIEAMIKEKGADIGFPINISINSDAAHYTPENGCTRELGEKDLVKLDIGTHVDGFIGDAAITVDLSGEYAKLVEASEKALENAAALLKPGCETSAIGAMVEETIKGYGYKPISNLTGHSINRWQVHSDISIPNIKTKDSVKLEEGMVIALEPFATDGIGRIKEGQDVEIFSLVAEVPVRMRETRRLMNYIKKEFQILPFAERWLFKEFKSKLLLNAALKELVMSGALQQYPVLREEEGGMVSQAEATFYITADGAERLTKK